MIFLVKKKDGKARPVIDYRAVNAGTITEPFPPPDTEEIFDRLAGAEWYAVAGLTCGYWQMEIDEASSIRLSVEEMGISVSSSPILTEKRAFSGLQDLNL